MLYNFHSELGSKPNVIKYMTVFNYSTASSYMNIKLHFPAQLHHIWPCDLLWEIKCEWKWHVRHF